MEEHRPEQQRREEREYRELSAEIAEIIRALGELEERWQTLNPQPEDRSAQTEGVNERILQFIQRWVRFPSAEMQLKLEPRIVDLSERSQRFPEQPPSFRWLHEVAAPLLQLRRITIPEGNTNNDFCVICHENFVFGEVARDLRCGHRYHQTCIFQWAAVQPNCPLCRVHINEAPAQVELVEIISTPSLQDVAVPLLQLPRITIPEGNTNNDFCIICQENFLFGEVARDLRCGHRFHETCIFRWAAAQPNCPSCRAHISEEP